MNSGIRGVLFDVGGVLVALDGVAPLAALLGVEAHHETLHALWMTSPTVVAFETGKIESAQFAAGVVHDLKLPITPERFLTDFAGWHKGALPGATELVNEIPTDYRVAALSNTSTVHWNAIASTGIAKRFDQLFLSYEIGYMKPASEAFAIALEGMQLRPPEVIFLDDGLRNVEAAKVLGMNSHLVRGPDEARAVLAEYGVVPERGGA